MNEVIETAQPATKSLTVREVWRERIWLLVIALLILCCVGLGFKTIALIVEKESEAIIRSDDEMIDGGKRFIDGFYSLDASTVKGDQWRAIRMMVKKEDQDARLKVLEKDGLVREVEQARQSSFIDWSTAETEIKERYDNGAMVVEYKAKLVIDDRSIGRIHILLQLIPLAKSDDNTNGVGVYDWQDIAEDPFGVYDND